MVPNAPHIIAGSTPTPSNHRLSVTHSAWRVEPSAPVVRDSMENPQERRDPRSIQAYLIPLWLPSVALKEEKPKYFQLLSGLS